MPTAVYIAALTANVLWFGAAFGYFSFRQRSAASVLVPKPARLSPLFETLAASVRFLGGMNAVLALLSASLIVLAAGGSELFDEPGERVVLLVVLAAAHFSQFIFNVPVLRNGQRVGESFWYVTSGPMRIIFTVDATLTVANLLAATLVAVL